MPIKEYPFLAIHSDGRVEVQSQSSRPILWVRVTNPHAQVAIIIAAIVDTGADECTMPAGLAGALKHNLKSVASKSIHTAGGTTEVYPHTVRIEILDVLPNGKPNKSKVLYIINEGLFDFAKGLPVPLLGRKTFLDNFNLYIKYPARKFSIRKP